LRFESRGLCRVHAHYVWHNWGQDAKYSIGSIGSIGYFLGLSRREAEKAAAPARELSGQDLKGT
jgi:hypothetical protein